MTKLSSRDTRLLSDYLDGALNERARARLEARLQTDAALRAQLDALRQTRALLRSAPRRAVPRNFTLTPEMAGVRPPLPLSARFAPLVSLAAVLLLVFSVFWQPLGAMAPAATLAAAPEAMSAPMEMPPEEAPAAAPEQGAPEMSPAIPEAPSVADSAGADKAAPTETLRTLVAEPESAAQPEATAEIVPEPAPESAPALTPLQGVLLLIALAGLAWWGWQRRRVWRRFRGRA